MEYALKFTMTDSTEQEFVINIPNGQDGYSFQAKGTVATKANLPSPAYATIGDTYIVSGGQENEAGHMFILGLTEEQGNTLPVVVWKDMGRVVGKDGKDGTAADFDTNQFTTKVVDGKTVITLKNDSDIANQLTVIGKDGLFVRPASAQVRAKDKSVRVAGIPQDKNGGFNTEISVNISNESGNTIVVKEDGLFASGGGGDLDSKYIKVGEASDNKAAAVGGGDGTIVIGSGAGNGEMGSANKTTVIGSLSKSLSDGGSVFGYNCSGTGKQALAAGYACSAQGENSIALGNTAAASQRSGIALGWGTNALDTDSIAIGRNAKVDGNSSIAIGVGAVTAAQNTILLGTGASATGTNGIAIGQSTKSVFNAIVIGPLAVATGGNTTLLGYGTKAAQGSTAFGHSAQATGTFTVSIGVNSQATAENSIALGTNSIADKEDTLSIGSDSKKRRIVNLADGSDDSDAITVKQLKNLQGKLVVKGTEENKGTAIGENSRARGSFAFAVGGGVTLGAGGVSMGAYSSAQGENAVSLGYSARCQEAGGVAIGNNAHAGDSNSVAIGRNASAAIYNSVAIGFESETNQEDTVSFGSANRKRRIINIDDGLSDNDAVTVKQLKAEIAALTKKLQDAGVIK